MENTLLWQTLSKGEHCSLTVVLHMYRSTEMTCFVWFTLHLQVMSSCGRAEGGLLAVRPHMLSIQFCTSVTQEQKVLSKWYFLLQLFASSQAPYNLHNKWHVAILTENLPHFSFSSPFSLIMEIISRLCLFPTSKSTQSCAGVTLTAPESRHATSTHSYHKART